MHVCGHLDQPWEQAKNAFSTLDTFSYCCKYTLTLTPLTLSLKFAIVPLGPVLAYTLGGSQSLSECLTGCNARSTYHAKPVGELHVSYRHLAMRIKHLAKSIQGTPNA